jgi:hypothetical protein
MDWQIALRGALLVNLLYAIDVKQPNTLAAEIRQIEDKLGLSLSARDRLGFKLPEPEKPADAAGADPRERPDPRKA